MLLFPISLFRTLYIEGERKLDFAGWCAAIQVAAGSGGDTLSQQQLTETDIPVIVHSCISYITQCGERRTEIHTDTNAFPSITQWVTHIHTYTKYSPYLFHTYMPAQESINAVYIAVCCGLSCCFCVCKLGTLCVSVCPHVTIIAGVLALRETARQQNNSVPPPFLLLLPPCCFSSPPFCILSLPSLLILCLPPTFTSWPAFFVSD